MNATEVHAGYQPAEEGTTIKETTRGAFMESVGALATMALAIVGLTGAGSISLAAIATIILAAAIWVEGSAFALNRTDTFAQKSAETRFFELSEGFGADFLGGLAGIVLGVLALLGVAPIPLLSVSALVLGATFLLSSASGLASKHQPMFGPAGLILGLLAVVGLDSITLVLVALLCLGTAALFNGVFRGARSARMARLSHAG